MSLLFEQVYNPDILNCLANLSSDEVFTPPEVVNKMLDLLPQELFENPSTTFLDPACKTGVFLREIAKRLLVGLKGIIPDEDERRKHIFTKQLFGIAITEMTSLISRRSLYCSKYANTIYSIVPFQDVEGNIRFKNMEHYWEENKCGFCGANKAQYDRDKWLEQHAYEFIHTNNPQEIFNMKFDVIISNPPYQISDGGFGVSAKPIYNLFVEQALKLNPRYLSMIIPARWYSGGKGLDDFRDRMLNDDRIVQLTDYFDSTECFPGVDLSGGVCFFLWDRDNPRPTHVTTIRNGKILTMQRDLLEKGTDIFIRFNEAVTLYRKIASDNMTPFSSIVSARKPFGFGTKGFPTCSPKHPDCVEIYAYPENSSVMRKDIRRNLEAVDKHKVFIAKAYGERGSFPYLVTGKPFYAPPGTCASETYLMVGPFDSVNEATNAISYMKTRIFRFMVLLKKNTQDAPRRVYDLVPIQDFSHLWTDEILYAKYNLTDEEVAFIESMIRPMD